MSILYFVILIGVLIFVHEFGHFIVAKAFDVKVQRFSIGFGPKIAGFTKGETEYVICALPLGGYVQMLGFALDEVEEIPEDERDRALMMKPIWQRTLITLAGPGANVILPILIYFIATMGMTTAPPAKVGEVFSETPAAEAGLMPGDRIAAIDGEDITYWHELQEIISDSYDKEVELEVVRDGETLTVNVTPEKKTRTDFLGLNKKTYGMLGIHLTANGTTVAVESPDTPAAQGGLETFDDVLTVDGEPVKRYDEIASSVRQSDGKSLDVRMLHRQPIDADYGRFYAQHAGSATVTPEQVDGEWSIGIDRVEMYLAKVEPESPAEKAGLQTGDKILALDGRTFSNFSMLDDRIKNDANKAIMKQQKEDSDSDVEVNLSYTLSYKRDGETQETTLEPEVTEFKDDNGTTRYRVYVGWGHLSDRAQVENIPFPFFPRMGYAAERSVTQTYAFVEMMVTGFVRMAEGRVGTESIGGPIMIGELAAKAGKAGWGPFLNMMALISINLAVINLLPIPVLDGGHLVLYFLEAVKRGPLSYRTRQIAAYIGFVIIVFLMVFAFKNDIERNWEDIVQWLNSL